MTQNPPGVGFEIQGAQLRAVGFGIQAEAAGDRETGLGEARQVRGFGAETGGIGGLGGA